MPKSENHENLIQSINSAFIFALSQFRNHIRFWKIKKYANIGVPVAKAILGAMYSKGVGVTTNHSESFKWYCDAAYHGNVSAQLILGVRYAVGIGVAKDYSEAIRWYGRAALQNNPKAQCALGLMYAKGLGARQDLVWSCTWLNLSIIGGYKEISGVRDFLHSQLSFGQIKEVQKLTCMFHGGFDDGGIPSSCNR